MDKLKRLEKKLRDLRYHCEFRIEFGIPQVRIWAYSYLAYIVYQNGAVKTDEGLLLMPEKNIKEIATVINNWRYEEGYTDELNRLNLIITNLGLRTDVGEGYFHIWAGNILVGKIGLSGVLSEYEDFCALDNETKKNLEKVIDEWNKGRQGVKGQA